MASKKAMPEKEQAVKEIPEKDQAVKEIPDESKEAKPVPESGVKIKEMPQVGVPENTVIIGGNLIDELIVTAQQRQALRSGGRA